MSSSAFADAPVLDVRTPGGALLAHARVARSIAMRFRGLIARSLTEGEGMLFPGVNSVHTHFMSYPIDLVYLSKDATVVKVVAGIRPWRFSWGGRRAKHVLELPAGTAAALGVEAGLQLDVVAAEPAAVSTGPAVRP